MADVIALLQPRIIDRDSFQEFVEALEDQVPSIERDIAALRKSPTDRALIARLFRSLHTIKGDAAICKVDVGVMICHPMESLLARCRDGEILFFNLLAEVILLSLDRLELTVEAMGQGRDVGHLNLPQLVGGLEGIATAPAAEMAARAAQTIEAVTGFRPLQATAEIQPTPRWPRYRQTTVPTCASFVRWPCSLNRVRLSSKAAPTVSCVWPSTLMPPTRSQSIQPSLKRLSICTISA